MDIRGILVKTTINLACRQYINRIISEIIDLLENATPETIWKMVTNNVMPDKMTNEQKEEVFKRIRTGVKIARRIGAEKLVRDKIEEIKITDIIMFIAKEAYRRKIENNRPNAIKNLMFIVMNKPALKWFIKFLEEMKKFILESWDKICEEEGKKWEIQTVR